MNANYITELERHYDISKPNEIEKYIENNKETMTILNELIPILNRHFPTSNFSVELCDKLNWTDEEKILLKVYVSEDMFFNGIINEFNEIYEEISYFRDNISNNIVLFPLIENKNNDILNINNLIARESYFNGLNSEIMITNEINIRNISKEQQKNEIIEYCEKHETVLLSDIADDLRLDVFEVNKILEELIDGGILEE